MSVNIPEGEKLLLVQNDKQIILKKAGELSINNAEDIEFANKTEEAWKILEAGNGIKWIFKPLQI